MSENSGPSLAFLRSISHNHFKLSEVSVKMLRGGAEDLSVLVDRPTVLNFFITQCGPCRREFPALLKAKSILQNELRVIPVNVGESEESVVNYFKEVAWDGDIILDHNKELAKQFTVIAYPTTYLISPAGQIGFFVENDLICQCFIGGRDWDDESMVQFLQDAARKMT